MAAQDDQLAVVWHGGLPAADGDQALQYSVYRVSAQSKAHSGALYLSGRSHLSWLGFSETGLLAAHDTQVRLQPRLETHCACSSLCSNRCNLSRIQHAILVTCPQVTGRDPHSKRHMQQAGSALRQVMMLATMQACLAAGSHARLQSSVRRHLGACL